MNRFVLVAFIAHALAKDSADKLVSKLTGRALHSWSPAHQELQYTALGKPTHLITPSGVKYSPGTIPSQPKVSGRFCIMQQRTSVPGSRVRPCWRVRSSAEDQRKDVAYLKKMMQVAIKSEDYAEAGRLKKAIEEAEKVQVVVQEEPGPEEEIPLEQDWARLRGALKVAIDEEDYLEAARLKKLLDAAPPPKTVSGSSVVKFPKAAPPLNDEEEEEEVDPLAKYRKDINPQEVSAGKLGNPRRGARKAITDQGSLRQDLQSTVDVWDRMADIEAAKPIERVEGSCHCGRSKPYKELCGILHNDPTKAKEATALNTHYARYSAFCEATPEAIDYIMDTTHRNNSEYQEDRSKWRAQLFSFCRSSQFVDFKILQILRYKNRPEFLELMGDEEEAPGEASDGDRTFITWKARIRVLGGIVDDKNVETKDFLERSVFVHEGGRWLYVGGSPDFEPKTRSVSGPLSSSGGGSGVGPKVQTRIAKDALTPAR